MSKEEFMKRYKKDMENKAKKKEQDYKSYIIELHAKRMRGNRK